MNAMMKKYGFSLILSAALFTTSPLFAMRDNPEVVQTALSTLAVKFRTKEEIEGRGTFSICPDPVIQYVIEKSENDKTAGTIACVSKVMNFLCQEPLYKIYAKKFHIPLDSTLPPGPQVTAFFNQFNIRLPLCDQTVSNPQQIFSPQEPFRISIKQLKALKQTLFSYPNSEKTWALRLEASSNPKPGGGAWTFSFKGAKYQIINSSATQDYQDHLDELDQDATLLVYHAAPGWSYFMKSGSRVGPEHHNANVIVCCSSAEMKDLSSPEYEKIIKEARENKTVLSENYFHIRKLLPQ